MSRQRFLICSAGAGLAAVFLTLFFGGQVMAQTVEMRIGNAVHQVTLNDNDAARSFAARLPLTLQCDLVEPTDPSRQGSAAYIAYGLAAEAQGGRCPHAHDAEDVRPHLLHSLGEFGGVRARLSLFRKPGAARAPERRRMPCACRQRRREPVEFRRAEDR